MVCGDLRTALHLSSLVGPVASISVLLDQNADPTLRDVFGRTPLFIAAEQGKTELMAFLLEKDPTTVSIPNNELWTPLHVSAWNMQSATRQNGASLTVGRPVSLQARSNTSPATASPVLQADRSILGEQ